MKRYLVFLLLLSCQSGQNDGINFSKKPLTSPKEIRQEAAEEGKNITFAPTVYFAFDSSAISLEARKKLNHDIAWLQENRGSNITLAGHCDERGTKEYNLALGERRAYAVKNYLVKNGVSASRIKTISYGEEKPAVLGANENAYSKNRRVELKTK